MVVTSPGPSEAGCRLNDSGCSASGLSSTRCRALTESTQLSDVISVWSPLWRAVDVAFSSHFVMAGCFRTSESEVRRSCSLRQSAPSACTRPGDCQPHYDAQPECLHHAQNCFAPESSSGIMFLKKSSITAAKSKKCFIVFKSRIERKHHSIQHCTEIEH